MRRKPSGQGNYSNNNNGGGGGTGGGGNNHQRKHRYQNNNGGGGNHNQNRPRKNYAAAREKYLSQARDALAQGDRVLAENYFQHADHCYRMMVEEGYNTRNTNLQNQPAADSQGNDMLPEANQNQPAEEAPQDFTDNVTQLPAFLTGTIIEEDRSAAPVAPQNWEE